MTTSQTNTSEIESRNQHKFGSRLNHGDSPPQLSNTGATDHVAVTSPWRKSPISDGLTHQAEADAASSVSRLSADPVNFHWADLTVNSNPLSSLYSVIPSLESVRLRSFHLNWRGPALTLRIDLPSYPEHVPTEWSGRGHDTLQVHVQFAAVEHLTVRGCIPTVPVNVSLSGVTDRRILAHVAAVGFELSFTSGDCLSVGHISSFRVTESGSDEGVRIFVSPLDTRRFKSLPGTHEGTFYERA